MEDGADESISAVVSYAITRLKTAEDPTDVDGSAPRMLGLRLLA